MFQTELMLFLLSIPHIGKQTILKLYQEFDSFNTIYNASEIELKKILSTKQLSSFLNIRERTTPKELMQELSRQNIFFYSIFDKEYPNRLLQIPDAPLGIFVKGTLPPNDAVTVSVIGARRNSYYGEKQTRAITQKLTQNNFHIVSGMAKGIDGIAQKIALENHVPTYAILGCGVNICYPPENSYLFNQIPLHGGLISEYTPNTNPCTGYFPMRNRIISGLGDVLIVTEAREKSGTFITVDMALEQGKDIFVLPGRIDDPLSIGCNRLIAQGAHIILDLDELIELIKNISSQRTSIELPADKLITKLISLYGVEKNKTKKETASKRINPSRQDAANLAISQYNLSEEEIILLSLLDYHPQSLDTLHHLLNNSAYKKELSISDVSIYIMNLCFHGLARQENGLWYTKV